MDMCSDSRSMAHEGDIRMRKNGKWLKICSHYRKKYDFVSVNVYVFYGFDSFY